MKNNIWLIWLAVMWQNLVRNIANKWFKISVFNRTEQVTKDFLEKKYNDNINWFYDLKEFVNSLESPRKIILLVKSDAVSSVLNQLKPLLNKEDIVIDCGNSFFKDTESLINNVKEFNFLWCWISWWEEGALNWPSIMPWLPKENKEYIYQQISPILTSIAAKDFNWKPCVTLIWNNGAWHFVKMVHNGIEYSIMGVITEVYKILKNNYKVEHKEIKDIFDNFNKGKLNSYLIEIISEILNKKDEFHKDSYLIDFILDEASSKWTWLWTSFSWLELNSDVSSIITSVIERQVSSDKKLRKKLSNFYNRNDEKNIYNSVFYYDEWKFKSEFYLNEKESRERFEDLKDFNKFKLFDNIDKDIYSELESSLYIGIVLSYIQGLNLIIKANETFNWDINLSEVVRIWQGWCIIRSKFLIKLENILKEDVTLNNIYLSKVIKKEIEENIGALKNVIIKSLLLNQSTPILSSSLQSFYSNTSEDSWANLIQGMRDYFWAHTYKRVDREWIFHTNWY